jgi:hypothetical protein
MAKKNRRLSPASVYRYYLKRYTMNVGTTAHLLSKEITADPEAMRAIAKLSMQETYNWLTDYAPSHLAKEVVKNVAEKYGIPTTFQGLLMSFAEKVLANYILDYKGEPLVEIYHNFLWTLMQRPTSGIVSATTGYLYTFVNKTGKPYTVDMSKVLTEIQDELFKLLK